MIKDKNIVLGVTGGIAAYKAVEIASRLRKAGAKVHVVMTKAATSFVTELTFREITGNPVTTTMWGEVANWNVEHIALAKLADLVLIAAGFLGTEKYVADAFGVELNARTNVSTAEGAYATSVKNVFVTGDMHRGQSLVVWAIREGREAACQVAESLMGYSNLVVQ